MSLTWLNEQAQKGGHDVKANDDSRPGSTDSRVRHRAIACNDDGDDSDSTVDSEAQLCNDIADLGQALAAFAALGPDSTVDDLKTARDGVVDAGEKVDESAEKVGEARVSDVDSAVSDLRQSVEDVSDDATITEAVESVQTQILAVDAAALQFFSDLNCAT